MGTRDPKNTRAAKRRVRKTTDSRPTEAERAEAARMLAKGGQLDAVRAGYFCTYATFTERLPIAGTPKPKSCPFCGKTDDIRLVIKDTQAPHKRVHAECGVCGAEAPGVCTDQDDVHSLYGACMKAALYWNTRGGGLV